MDVQTAVKKYKMDLVYQSVKDRKIKDLNVNDVIYMLETKNKQYYIVKDGPSTLLYRNDRNLYTKQWSGVKVTKLD